MQALGMGWIGYPWLEGWVKTKERAEGAAVRVLGRNESRGPVKQLFLGREGDRDPFKQVTAIGGDGGDREIDASGDGRS